MIGMSDSKMYKEGRSPLIAQPKYGERDLAYLIQSNANAIEERLIECGAVLFRGFAVQDERDFDRFVSAMTVRRMDYTYGSTPRTSVGNRIFTASEYPADQEIQLHNESSYQREWPLKIALCCLAIATSGGETPIADMRRVTKAIGATLLDKLELRRIRYVRHYQPFVDVPWQKVFQTANQADVGSFCERHDIAYDWIAPDTLRTIHVCQGASYHPVTEERVFFNQAHLFHVSSAGPEAEKWLVKCFGPDRLPRQAYYGDGQDIPTEDLLAIRSAFLCESVTFPWQTGDVLLLDNMQFAHGRRAFRGTRKVIAALMDPYSQRREVPPSVE
jgi:alpha-ketoglutarate-dependent taurine dioxygenase